MKIKLSTREVWDKVYGNFIDFNSLDLAFYERLFSIITNNINESKSILEVGSGSGFLASLFQNKGMFSVGLDRSVMPIQVARIKFRLKNTVLGDMFHIPFKSDSFDVVWNEGVIEHFKDPINLKACKEMARVSKNLVIIAVPQSYTIWVARKMLMKLIGKWPYGYEESYTPRRLKYLMEQAGLQVLSIRGVRVIPPIKERKKLSDLLALGLLALPLHKSTIDKIANNMVTFEERHELLTRILGYEIIAIGIKKTNP